MKLLPLPLLAAAALLMNACEQHPLPGELPRSEHAEGANQSGEVHGGKPAAPGEHRDDAAQPAQKEAAKPAEGAQFFPEKK